MILSRKERVALLKRLVEASGFDTIEQLLESTVVDSVSPAICVNAGCDYTTEMEPDQREGYCEICGTNTVQAALVLAGMV